MELFSETHEFLKHRGLCLEDIRAMEDADASFLQHTIRHNPVCKSMLDLYATLDHASKHGFHRYYRSILNALTLEQNQTAIGTASLFQTPIESLLEHEPPRQLLFFLLFQLYFTR